MENLTETKEMLVISPRECDKELDGKEFYVNDSDWLSSISTDHHIKQNGGNELKIKNIHGSNKFKNILLILILLSIRRIDQRKLWIRGHRNLF